jgi:PQQ-dependent dehydrogenase (methanol/ethanol family)
MLPCTAQSAPKAQAPASASPRDDGQWLLPAKDFANTRFSELSQITPANVSKLSLVMTVSAGTIGGQESAVLMAENTAFFVTSYPNTLVAVDLTKPGGEVKWRFNGQPAASAQGVTCCGPVSRGPAYANGTIYFNTIDLQTIALDAKTGAVKWRVKLGDYNKGESITMAPFVVRDKVLVGNSGAEYGARGWLTALNAKDGSIAWRAYSTGPDRDVLIEPKLFKPFYPQFRGRDLGVKQWPADAWRIGGGTVWGWISYDPDQNLIFYGTSNPSPWNHEVRPGDNHWTNGIFARDPDTGKARWFYQFSPADLWDHSAVNENIVLDMPWKGAMRKTVVRPERNGYMYVLDRTSGEVLAADPYVHITASRGVDMKTGRLRRVPEMIPTMGKVMRDVCPNSPGAKDWSPSAFSKVTGLLYVPHNNVCMDWELKDVSYLSGTPYIGAETRFYPGPGGFSGGFFAWDPVNRRKVWSVTERWPVWSGAAVTAGNVVFYGDLEGWFKALDASTGKLLWKYKTASGIIGQPTIWKGHDGRQYVAILSGIGGWVGSIITNDLDPRDTTAQKGFANMTGELKKKVSPGGMLYVFALPQ